jgi:hypothetical protein
MRKNEELNNPDSCTNRAHNDEMLFVLMGRDLASPATIRFWVTERIRLGKNAAGDQTRNALEIANRMERSDL